jgi:hypothetical protein
MENILNNITLLVMENNKIQILAEKYWEGQTNISEENELRAALKCGEVPQGLESLAEYLKYTEQAKNQILSDDFDMELLKSIDKPKTSVFQLPMLAKIAAAILLLFIGTYVFQSYENSPMVAEQNEFIDTYDNPEEAYREVKKAMMMVSKNMEQGVQYTGLLGEFDRVATSASGK